MSDIVIKVENIGKKYIIGHQGKAGYKTFREQIFEGTRNVFSKSKRLLTGQQVVDGDEIEEFWALQNLNFEIKQGDRVGIIGRNGAGKSTLLKILSRITEPTTGRVSIKGRVASLLEVGTGFHPELSGRENIFLNGAILGMSRNEIKKKFDEIVEFSGIEKFLDTPVKRYSSGMYVRLAFAIAAHLEPEILIVDEVLAVGDAEFQKKCLGKMEEVSKSQGRTVLFVSHQLGMVSDLCDSCIVLDNGQLVMKGKTQDTINFYLNTQNSDPYYTNTSRIEQKAAYISQLKVINEDGMIVSEVDHSNGVVLEILMKANLANRNYGIGLALLDRYKKRVFTINLNVREYFTSEGKECRFVLELPKGFFMPGNYSWAYTVNVGYFEVFDSNMDCCGFKIIDTGSEFAAFEQHDNGVIFMKNYNFYKL